MKQDGPYGQDVFGMFEVYYDAAGTVTHWSEEATPVVAETLDGLKWMQDKMGEALAKPILLYSNGKDS